MSHPALDFDLEHAVGAVVVEAAFVEKCSRLLWVSLMGSPYGEIAVSSHAEKAVLDDCKALVRVNQNLDASQRERGLEILTELDRLRDRRNRIVHSILAWPQQSGQDPQAPHLIALYDSRRKPGQAEQISLAELKELPGRLRSAATDLLEWSASCLPPQQQIHPN